MSTTSARPEEEAPPLALSAAAVLARVAEVSARAKAGAGHPDPGMMVSCALARTADTESTAADIWIVRTVIGPIARREKSDR